MIKQQSILICGNKTSRQYMQAWAVYLLKILLGMCSVQCEWTLTWSFKRAYREHSAIGHRRRRLQSIYMMEDNNNANDMHFNQIELRPINYAINFRV